MAIVGSLLGPSVTWTFLRRGPLGRAAVHCALGGALGVVPGFVLGLFWGIPGVLTPIAFGAAAAALFLRDRYPGRNGQPKPPADIGRGP